MVIMKVIAQDIMIMASIFLALLMLRHLYLHHRTCNGVGSEPIYKCY